MVLIHLDGDNIGEASDEQPGLQALWPRAEVLELYCRWAATHASSVSVLLPERVKSRLSRGLITLGRVSPVWYNGSGVTVPSQICRRGAQVWVINGGQLPLVDWTAAWFQRRQHRADVLMFGRSHNANAPKYPESVLVDRTGEVVQFRRHYCDSPGSPDRWNGDAAFFSVSGKNVKLVVNHFLARGWGLDSIGALTRHVAVRWASTPCAASGFAPVAPDHTLGSPGPGNGHDRSRTDGGGTTLRMAGDAISLGGPKGSGPASTLGQREPALPQPVSAPEPAVAAGDAEQRAFGPAQALYVSQPEVGSTRAPREKRPRPGWMMPAQPLSRDLAYRVIKRLFDLTAAGLSLAVLSPMLLMVAVLIKATSRGPVFFAHRRQGLRGKEFSCLKFRSMRLGADREQAALRQRNEVDGPQFKMQHDPRLTPVGNWIRRHNVDELPQLINVLLGQMSLVGPRPSPDNENQYCPAWRRTRLSVKPGITGLWQVLRRRDEDESQSDFQEWIYYDVEYARHNSLWLDLQILLYTPASMFATRRLKNLARRLANRGICRHSSWLTQT